MSDEQENLREQVSYLLLLKKSLQAKIKEIEIMLIEESEVATDDQTDIEVMKSIDKLETTIINASCDLMCHEKALKGAEMNWLMCKYLRLDSTNEMLEDLPQMEKDRQTIPDNLYPMRSALALIEINNAAQIKYLGVLREVEELQEQVVEKQSKSLEWIYKTRELKQKLDHLGKEDSRRDTDDELESQLARLLQQNLQTYGMVSSMFQELIFCSKVDYVKTPKIKSLVLSLGKELELEK